MSNLENEFLEPAKEEFKEIIEQYMLPLFAVDNTGTSKYNTDANKELITYTINAQGNQAIRFYPRKGDKTNPAPFYYEIETDPQSSRQRIPTPILQELLRVAEYGCRKDGIRQKRTYKSNNNKHIAYKKRTLDLAFELGMCATLTGSDNVDTLHDLLCKMIEWAGKTYEGKKVPFGIVIDFDQTVTGKEVNYINYLNKNSSAVFTDGTETGILLDKNGNIIDFLTRDTSLPLKHPLPEDDHEIFVPFSLYKMAQHCTGNTIGVIVLTNEEILLIKNRQVWFARRGNKWILFDWSIVQQRLLPYFTTTSNISEKTAIECIRAIYCTILDISFSHTGGCLAICAKSKDDKKLKKYIKDSFNDYISGLIDPDILEKCKEKLEVIIRLLDDGNSSLKRFFALEKPLRKEILSLDGATVIFTDGEIYCAGSIISVKGGSTEGGRSAAAKRLAELGVGIKISEDGYIEAYGIPLKDLRSNTTPKKVISLFRFG